jgi:hypothetical protein
MPRFPRPRELYLPGWPGGWSAQGGLPQCGIRAAWRKRLPPQVQAFVEWLRAQGRLPAELPRPGKATRTLSTRIRTARCWRKVCSWSATPRPGPPRAAKDSAGGRVGTAGRPRRDRGSWSLPAGGPRVSYRTWIEARFRREVRRPAARFVLAGCCARSAPALRSPCWTRHVLLDRWFLHAGQPALAFDR